MDPLRQVIDEPDDTCGGDNWCVGRRRTRHREGVRDSRRGIRLIARGRAGLEGARQDVEVLGGRAVAVVADVCDSLQVEAAADEIEQQLGPPEVWVNDAMTSVFSPIKATTPEEFRRVTDVTYLGAVYGTLSALRPMLPRDRGSIVQVGSALAYRGIPLQAAYCGAKHAIQGFCDSLRAELLHDRSGVSVTMVQLPAMNTPQFDWVKSRLTNRAQPVPPIYQPEVATEAIVWASQQRRREIYVGASTDIAIIGTKAAPRLRRPRSRALSCLRSTAAVARRYDAAPRRLVHQPRGRIDEPSVRR
jgi:NAD(P)-dependent dehydrogenase (short-subunit alcohol dehydrogenase family)